MTSQPIDGVTTVAPPYFKRPGFWIGLIAPTLVVAVVGIWAWQALLASPAGESVLEEFPVQAGTQIAVPVTGLSTLPEITDSAPGIQREVNFHTNIPVRGADWISYYTVVRGDTVSSIAARFNLKLDTIVWGNPEMLVTDANILKPGMQLNILPVDGSFYFWKEGDTLKSVAEDWNTTIDAIINWPGNKINPLDPYIYPGTWIIIPGGIKPYEWEAPLIRTGKSATFALGAGQCPAGYDGPMGTGDFRWPSGKHYLSGTDFMPPAHPGIDIAIYMGEPMYSIDAGVVVFSGWSQNRDGTPGYGYLVIIDHLNGYHSFYAHLSQINVTCGKPIPYAGYPIGLGGSTGNSTGPHLHFEIRFHGVPQNPWGLLP